MSTPYPQLILTCRLCGQAIENRTISTDRELSQAYDQGWKDGRRGHAELVKGLESALRQIVGYDEDSRKAEKAHRACERSSVKARQLLGEDDLYDLCNALNEQEAA